MYTMFDTTEYQEIRIRNIRGVKLYDRETFGDWIDLAAAEDVVYNKDEYVMIPLGIAVELPKKYEAHILPRSSTFRNYGLLHASSGLIDQGYCGDGDEWYFACYAAWSGAVKRGDRVCQFRIMEKMPPVLLKEVSTLGNTDRGGFGSSGK